MTFAYRGQVLANNRADSPCAQVSAMVVPMRATSPSGMQQRICTL